MDYFYLSFSFWIFLFLHQSSDAAAIYQEVNLFFQKFKTIIVLYSRVLFIQVSRGC